PGRALLRAATESLLPWHPDDAHRSDAIRAFRTDLDGDFTWSEAFRYFDGALQMGVAFKRNRKWGQFLGPAATIAVTPSCHKCHLAGERLYLVGILHDQDMVVELAVGKTERDGPNTGRGASWVVWSSLYEKSDI